QGRGAGPRGKRTSGGTRGLRGDQPGARGARAGGHYLASTKMYSAPVGWMTVCTRALSAASPMNTTRTPFIESACTSLNTTPIMSAILAEAEEPNAIMLPGLTPRLMVVVA